MQMTWLTKVLFSSKLAWQNTTDSKFVNNHNYKIIIICINYVVSCNSCKPYVSAFVKYAQILIHSQKVLKCGLLIQLEAYVLKVDMVSFAE